MNERLLANLYIAIDAVVANKMRSLLTALGIIFGVAAVIYVYRIDSLSLDFTHSLFWKLQEGEGYAIATHGIQVDLETFVDSKFADVIG